MATTKKRAAAPKQRLRASEAVYGFTAWLTTRQNPIILSSTHNASAPAELVAAFCKENNLPEVRDNYTELYQVPQGMEALTNVEQPPAQSVARSYTVQEVIAGCMNLLRTQKVQDQNRCIATILQFVKNDLTKNHQLAKVNKMEADYDESYRYDDLQQFTNIVNGNFTVIT